MIFQSRFFTRDNKTGGAPSPIADITNCAKAGDSAPIVAYRTAGNCGPFEQGDKTGALNTATDPNQNIIASRSAVRRLTPLECLRLQGFPDDWFDGLGFSDSVKYRMCGNAVAVPCVEWIFKRLSTPVPD